MMSNAWAVARKHQEAFRPWLSALNLPQKQGFDKAKLRETNG